MPKLMREHRGSCLPVCRIGQAVNSAAVDLLWLHRICSHHHSHSATLITCGPTARKTRHSKRQTANNLLPDSADVGLTQGYAASVLGVPGHSGDGASGSLYIWHRDEIPFNKNCRDYIKWIRCFPLNCWDSCFSRQFLSTTAFPEAVISNTPDTRRCFSPILVAGLFGFLLSHINTRPSWEEKSPMLFRSLK